MVDFRKKKIIANYDQNDGVAGVVYILGNPALAWNHKKIGCSRYSGKKRATDLNKEATTAMPAQFFCLFEQKTIDCGLAEKRVFQRLVKYRKGKKGQEFFKVEFEEARTVVIEECQKVDQEHKQKEEAKKIIEGKRAVLGTRKMLGRYALLTKLEKKK